MNERGQEYRNATNPDLIAAGFVLQLASLMIDKDNTTVRRTGPVEFSGKKIDLGKLSPLSKTDVPEIQTVDNGNYYYGEIITYKFYPTFVEMIFTNIYRPDFRGTRNANYNDLINLAGEVYLSKPFISF